MAFKIKLPQIKVPKINLDKAKKAVKAVTAPAKKIVQKTVQVAKNVLDKGKEAATLALFAPFAPLARTFLKRRGIAPASTLRALALQVHNERSKKSFGYGGGDLFDYGQGGQDEFGELSHYGLEGDEGGQVAEQIPITPSMVQNIILFLKSIFDAIKKKKDAGEPLSADEQAIAEMAPQIDTNLESAVVAADTIVKQSEVDAANVVNTGTKAAAEADEKELGWFQSNWKVVLAVVILVLLFIWWKTR